MKTIICLVSRQAMANVIPVLELKPQKVMLLITKEEEMVALNLRKLFSKYNIDTIIFNKKLDAYDIDDVKKVCMDVIRKSDDEVILNLTGGTKTMAVAAYEIFRSVDKKIIYHNPVGRKLIFLNPLNHPDIEVSLKINVEDYLLAHGYKITEEKTSSGMAEKYIKLFKNFDKSRFSDFIDFYNYSKKEIKLEDPKVSKQFKDFNFSKSYDKITLIDKKNNIKLNFSLSGFNFGDWLESLLFLTLKEKYYPDDIKYSVKVKKGGISSEIDVMFTRDCRLYLYSCKDKKKTTKSDIYEIEVLRNVTGGTFGEANLVLTNDNPYLVSLGKQINIKTFNIKELF